MCSPRLAPLTLGQALVCVFVVCLAPDGTDIGGTPWTNVIKPHLGQAMGSSSNDSIMAT